MQLFVHKFVPKGPIDNSPADNGLAPIRRQAIIWTNADPIHWRIYAALEKLSYVRTDSVHLQQLQLLGWGEDQNTTISN